MPDTSDPGPALDRAAAELAEAERQVRALARCRSNGGALEIVLAELDRQRETLTGCIAENQRLYAERDDLMVENRRICSEVSRMGAVLDRARERATYWTQQFDAANEMVIELRSERDSARRERDEALTRSAERGAELDRQRGLIAAVLADLDKVEEDSRMFRRTHGGGLMPAIVEVPRIRALLGGEGS